MMTTLILMACLSGDGICHAPPINPRFNTRIVIKTKTISRGLCRCNAEGNLVCECARGVCGDVQCPSKPVPLKEEPTAAPAPEFSHWETVRQCGPNGCSYQRVARYRVRRGR